MIHIIYLSVIFILATLVYCLYKLKEIEKAGRIDAELHFNHLADTYTKAYDELYEMRDKNIELAEQLSYSRIRESMWRSMYREYVSLNKSLQARVEAYSDKVAKVDRRKK